MNKIKHIIWDWNGTLLNDAWLFVKLLNKILSKRSLNKINTTIYKNTFCFPLENFYMKMGFDFSKEPFEKSSLEFIKLYGKCRNEASLYDGVKPLLLKLNKNGINNYLLSAQNETTLIEQVNFYGLSSFFNSIMGTNNSHARGKDLTANILFEKINGNIDEILIIGDTNLDMEIAKKFNCKAIGVTYGHQAINRFESNKNIHLITSFNELDFYLTSLFHENL